MSPNPGGELEDPSFDDIENRPGGFRNLKDSIYLYQGQEEEKTANDNDNKNLSITEALKKQDDANVKQQRKEKDLDEFPPPVLKQKSKSA